MRAQVAPRTRLAPPREEVLAAPGPGFDPGTPEIPWTNEGYRPASWTCSVCGARVYRDGFTEETYIRYPAGRIVHPEGRCRP